MAHLHTVIAIIWAGFGIYWFAMPAWQQRAWGPNPRPANRVSDRPWARLFHHALTATAFIFLFVPQTVVGPLHRHFLPASYAVRLIGLAITIAGLGLAVWARQHLAENWSSRVRIRVGHELIRTGPYARLRHPIYCGVLLGVIGTAIAVGRWRAIVSVFIILISYCIKARREDAMLAREFGEAWVEHRRHAGFLLPRL